MTVEERGMRIGELSDRTGVPVPTIKFYLREGLLPPGRRTGPNQARYDSAHVRRLRVVRTLIEVGGLPLSSVRKALDSGVVESATARPDPAALREARDFLHRRGWSGDHPAVASLAAVLGAARELGQHGFAARLDHYADACAALASTDVVCDEGESVEGRLLAAVLGEVTLTALLRLARAETGTAPVGAAVR